MSEKQFLLIVYDISNDRRRTKLHDALLGYGSPVQYSVFECLLDAKEQARMKKTVAKIISPKKDHVRTYYLCKTCLTKTEVTAPGPAVLSEPAAIIV